MNADGSGLRQLTRNAGRHRPAWSPDGRKIAFISWRDGGAAEIYVMNADGTDQRRLTRTHGDEATISPGRPTERRSRSAGPAPETPRCLRHERRRHRPEAAHRDSDCSGIGSALVTGRPPDRQPGKSSLVDDPISRDPSYERRRSEITRFQTCGQVGKLRRGHRRRKLAFTGRERAVRRCRRRERSSPPGEECLP